jgi:ABC-2 type transport system permease protein
VSKGGLLRAERRRLFKRRLTRYMLVIGIAVLAAIAVGTWISNEKIGPAQRAAAEQQAEANYQDNVRAAAAARAECERAKQAGETDGMAGKIPDCAMIEGPPREAFEARWFLPPTFDFKAGFEDAVSVFAGILALVAFVVGASFVGAEWNNGGMMNLLLWRPRRLQVLTGKLGTLLLGLFGTTVVLGALWTAAFWLIATYRGTTEKMTPGTWQSMGLTGVRGVGLILLFGAIGFGLASFGRHTAMALGTAVAVGVIGFVGAGIALSIFRVKFMERYLWPTYLQAWMEKATTLQNYDSCSFDFNQGECKPEEYTITWQQSGVLLGSVLLLTVGLAYWSMRRRDVT